jgi:hypothetical protein
MRAPFTRRALLAATGAAAGLTVVGPVVALARTGFDPARYVSDMEKSGHPVWATTRDGRLVGISFRFQRHPITPEQEDLFSEALGRANGYPDSAWTIGQYCIRIGRVTDY